MLGYKSTSVESFILLPGSRCSRLSTWHPLTSYELHYKKRTELIWVNQYSHKKVSTMLVDQNMSFFCQIVTSSNVTSHTVFSCVEDLIICALVLDITIDR